MKDIIIKGRHIRRELLYFAGCVAAISIVNAVCIVVYGTAWKELYTLWYIVLPVSALLYFLLIPFRYLGCWLGKVFKRCFCKK